MFQFLEKMPPIEVFIGLEAIRSSAEEVPGLPTRSELQQWLVEHDAIEKETEIFDTGELKKLRKFTRGSCYLFEPPSALHPFVSSQLLPNVIYPPKILT